MDEGTRVVWNHSGYTGPVRFGEVIRAYPSHIVVRWDNGELQAYGWPLVERGYIAAVCDQLVLF